MIDPRVLELSRRIWRRDPSRVNFETAVGTLAWVGEAGDLFEHNGDVVGWARLDPSYDRIRRPGEWDVAPRLLTWMAEDASVLHEILDAYDGDFHTKHAAADHEAAALLRGRGFTEAADEPFGVYLSRATTTQDVDLDDYRLTTMAELGDAALRARAHIAGWPDSTTTPQWWAGVMQRPEYDPAFDVIVMHGDEPVGAALLWVDEYCEFEPVGVSPQHRGRGLAQAMLRYGLALAADAGVATAIVGARGDDDYPTPRAVYGSVGFAPMAREVIVARL